jgi:hypothetical protein
MNFIGLSPPIETSTICVQHKWGLTHPPFACYSNGEMATPGQLVQAMGNALGIPTPTIAQYDRQLAEAGLRTVGGRGTSAARITAMDAANLLIAVLGSPISGPAIKLATEVCERFGSIPARQGPWDTSKLRQVGLPLAAGLPVTHIFRDLVAALIEGASRGEFYKRKADSDSDRDFVVVVNSPVPTAEVKWAEDQTILTSPKQSKDRKRLNVPVMRLGVPRLVYEYPAKQAVKTDLYQSRQITFLTLRTLGNLISTERNSRGKM